MKFFVFLLILFSNFCCFSQTKCPEEIKNFTGICCEFHPNGIISQQKKIKNGELVEEIKYYDEKGYLITNNSFDESVAIPVKPNHSDSIHYFVEKEAIFPGGNSEMMKFINKSLNYPKIDFVESFTCTVYIDFVIEIDGSISTINIKRGCPDCSECEKEVIRVIKLMPKWNPGQTNGKNVKSQVRIPIKFGF